MRLTNKVTNAFFGIIALISLFMPLIGYTTYLTAQEYNLADLINLLKTAKPSGDSTLLGNLGQYGYKEEGVLVLVFFALALVCLLATLVLSFLRTPYLASCVVTGLGFGSYLSAAVFFTKIGSGFVKGIIPTSAITSLSGSEQSESLFSALIGSFVSIQKMGVTVGVYVGIACFAVLFAVNLVFFIFRKRFNETDIEKKSKRKTRKTKRANKK